MGIGGGRENDGFDGHVCDNCIDGWVQGTEEGGRTFNSTNDRFGNLPPFQAYLGVHFTPLFDVA